MCDLLGISCNENDRASRSLPQFAKEFSDDNPDGWGIAYFDGAKAVIKRSQGKDDLKAKKSKLFRETWKKVRSKNFIAHVRLASRGICTELNCHPFALDHNVHRILERDWIFAHNGTIRGFAEHPRSKGTTDSENIFNEILDSMKKYLSSGKIRGEYHALKYAIEKIFKRYGRGITLNLLMSDGNMHYAFSHYLPGSDFERPIFMKRRGKAWGNVILLTTGKFVTPGYANEEWEKIPTDRLLVVNCGQIITLSDPI